MSLWLVVVSRALLEYLICWEIENMLARDAEEGIGAFIAKRKPEWTGE